jgi:hypothetical protein
MHFRYKYLLLTLEHLIAYNAYPSEIQVALILRQVIFPLLP